MFNGYVLYLQAVTTPNPFVKLPKLPFHKSLLLIFCLRLRFPFSFFKLFFAAAALVISHGGFGYFPGVACFSGGSDYFPGAACFSCGFGYFPGVALVIFPGRLWLFSRRGSGYFSGVAPVIFPGWPVFPAALVISHSGSGYFPVVVTLIILFWTYFYLYKKICPNNFYFWTYELQISLFMSKFHLNFAVFKHISVVLDLYSHFFGHKILFIPDYVQTPSITSTGLSNIHKLIYCTE